jgi:hypothetical protein
MPSAATHRQVFFQTCAIVADFDFGHFFRPTVAFPKTVQKSDPICILLSRSEQNKLACKPHHSVVLHHHWAIKK